MAELSRQTKLQALVAVFDRFHALLESIPGDTASAFVDNWRNARSTYINPPAGIRPSQLSSGLEQGLREFPLMFQSADKHHRAQLAQALDRAIKDEYPQFLEAQLARIRKVIDRGRISSESEYMLIRHEIDLLEGTPEESGKLETLYRLIDMYEARLHKKFNLSLHTDPQAGR